MLSPAASRAEHFLTVSYFALYSQVNDFFGMLMKKFEGGDLGVLESGIVGVKKPCLLKGR